MNRTILAIDCSQRRSVIAVARGPMVHERAFEPTQDHTREAFWDELRELCEAAGVQSWEFEAVAVATGPGGFTGLRIAIAFAKSFALASELPVIALGSAEIFAASDAVRRGGGPWLVALASKSGTAWCSRVTQTVEGDFDAQPGEVLDAAAFLPRLSAVAAAGGTLLCDEHLDPALAAAAKQSGVAVRSISCDPCALAALAHAALRRGRTVDAFALAPIYPREPEAVTKWRERHGGGSGASGGA